MLETLFMCSQSSCTANNLHGITQACVHPHPQQPRGQSQHHRHPVGREGSKHRTRGRREPRGRMWGEPSSLGHGARQGRGMKGWGDKELHPQKPKILLQPWEAPPRSTGREKTSSGTLQPPLTRCAFAGMGSSALERFSVPGFSTKPLEPGKELALICWELQTPAAQAAGIGSGSAPGSGKSNARGVERWNELRASIPTVEGSSTGTKPWNLCISTGVAKPQ